MGGDWTLAELADRAARLLAEGGVRAASGRVTEVPDPRLIRWYTTIGLLDRPTIGRGRIARYGPRHLLQLVAVKRLQAQGLPLAQIQQRLAGATDDQLRAIAALPAGFAHDRGDSAAPSAAVIGDGGGSRDGGGSPDGRVSGGAAASPGRPGKPGGRPERFWAARPAGPAAPKTPAAEGPSAVSPAAVVSPAAAESPASAKSAARVDSGHDTVARVYGLRLGGLTLLLPAEPAPNDLDDIAAAARPLLDLLADRGLLDPDGGSRR